MSDIRIETGSDYNMKEYRDWHFFLYYGNGITGILNTLGVIIVTAITASIFAGKIMSGNYHFKFTEIAMIAMDIYLLSIPFIIIYDTKDSISEEKFRSDGGKLIFTSGGIEIVTATGGTKIAWETITKVHITKKAFYLQYTKFNAIIVPRRMLKDDGEQNMVQLIKEKTGNLKIKS